MKKITVLCLLFIGLIGICFGIESLYSVGLGVYKDDSKTFIIDVVPNSPASRANIVVGSEITEINGQKTKQLSINEINSLLGGADGTNVSLVIKNPRKESYNLKREKIEDNRVVLDEDFLSYWSKISPKKYVTAHTLSNSPRYSNGLRLEIRVNNYWVQKRGSFEQKYILCKQASTDGFEACMNDTIAKTKSQIQSEQTSLFDEEKNQKIIRDVVRDVEMNHDINDFNNQMQRMYLGL